MTKTSGAKKLHVIPRSPAPSQSPLRNVMEKGLPALYYQLADVFRRRIEEGVWPVDSQIPTLDELVTQFGAARATVRQALTIIEGEGLVARHRGRAGCPIDSPARKGIEVHRRVADLRHHFRTSDDHAASHRHSAAYDRFRIG
jgi:DNA-binding FadR family transcriptional regulator